MHIPDRIQLGGFDIDIVHVHNMAKDKNKIGQSSYTTQEILLDKDAAPEQFVEQAYLHELVHWIFYSMSEYELMNNEKLVDLFATFLHQALTSGEKEKNERTTNDIRRASARKQDSETGDSRSKQNLV